MSILEEFYYGNINPGNKCRRNDCKYAEAIKTVSDNELKISAFLNNIPNADKEQDLFTQLIDAQLDIYLISKAGNGL